jgi:threonine aldolase
MRQAGIIAAAAIVALREMPGRLAEDHANARRLAEGIEQIEGLSIEAGSVQTNILYFNLVSDKISVEEFVKKLEKRGVRLLCLGGGGLFSDGDPLRN